MNDNDQRGSHVPLDSSVSQLKFSGGDFEFAHWLSNIGVGPQSLYAGAYFLADPTGTRRISYCLSASGSFDTERNHVSAPVLPDQIINSARFMESDKEARASIQSRVSWIASNGYPAVSLADLADITGVGGLTREEAIAATQASIWTLTDDFLFAGLLDADFSATERMLSVMDYLLDDSNANRADSRGDLEQDGSFADGSFVGLTRMDSAADLEAKSIRCLVISGQEHGASDIDARNGVTDDSTISDTSGDSRNSLGQVDASQLPVPVGFEGPSKQRRGANAGVSASRRTRGM